MKQSWAEIKIEERGRLRQDMMSIKAIIDRCRRKVNKFNEEHKLEPDEVAKFQAREYSNALSEVRALASLVS